MKRYTLASHLGLLSSILIATSASISNSYAARAIVIQCFEPEGVMIDAETGEFQKSDDRYSNSNPTFLFSDTNPNIITETWQSANPYDDLLTREQVDRISPPTSIESTIVHAGNGIIHAISIDEISGESYTTTLYLNDRKAVFTRVKTDTSGTVTGFPMGAVYVAECEKRFID